MGLGTAMMAGKCWNGGIWGLWRSITSTSFLVELTFIGARAYSEKERDRIINGGGSIISSKYEQHLRRRLGSIPEERSCVVHVDLDYLDTSIGRAKDYAQSSGLLADYLKAYLALLSTRQPKASIIASFDRDLERGDAILCPIV